MMGARTEKELDLTGCCRKCNSTTLLVETMDGPVYQCGGCGLIEKIETDDYEDWCERE